MYCTLVRLHWTCRHEDSRARLCRFSIVGDDNAAAYFAVSSQGEVSVRGNLRNAPGSEVYYSVSACRVGTCSSASCVWREAIGTRR